MSLIEISGYPQLFGEQGEGCLHLEAGECVVVRGDSGSGKSRLLRSLLRLDFEERGQLLLRGRDIRDWPQTELRQQFVLVPQDPPRPAQTAREIWERILSFRSNLDMDQQIQPLDALLERLDIQEQARRPMSELSGGEGRRLWLAMAFALHRPVLLLDEATSGLDERRSLAVWKLMQEQLSEGAAAIWVSHEALPLPKASARCYEIRASAKEA